MPALANFWEIPLSYFRFRLILILLISSKDLIDNNHKNGCFGSGKFKKK